ncbi:MAG: GH1 family beta-glucosidase [Candidatus Limnocylindria bacterium]
MADFPPEFLWGVATSSYQVEGAVDVDGRGESIWDRFSHTPGRIKDGSNGDVACDHYRRYADDVALMGDLGAGAYRFSIAWPRVVPSGSGAVNSRGLAFYDRLVDSLLEQGITPMATLYHWDLPQALEDRGGWESRDTVARFAEYADACYRALGDRVRRWITHNEPWVVGMLGYFRGVHAPGKTDLAAALRVIHHLLLSHGEAVRAFRASGRTGEIGITLSLAPTYPYTDSEADRAAAVASDGYTNRWFLDPVLRGAYPADMIGLYERAAGPLELAATGDLETIAQPTDFLGVNYYAPRVVRASTADALPWSVLVPEGRPVTAMGSEIAPEGLFDLLTRLNHDYGPIAIHVTENGAAFDDVVGRDGRVDDAPRVDFFRGHLGAAARAIATGVDLRGYFAWSLLDNFEWAEGYVKRFGIVYVDYATQRRIPKSSARYLSSIFRGGAI